MNEGPASIISYSTFDTRFGTCLVASAGGKICAVLFADEESAAVVDLQSRWPRAVIVKKRMPEHGDVREYFKGLGKGNGKSEIARIPMARFHLIGTDFQKRVWKALCEIPAGTTSTYGAIAKLLGDPKLSRAVGTAIGDNPIGYIVPCHRVLRTDGGMGGYRWGVERKKAMLEFERGMKANPR